MKTREAKVNALLAVADLLPYGQCTEQDAARAGLDAVIFEVAHPTHGMKYSVAEPVAARLVELEIACSNALPLLNEAIARLRKINHDDLQTALVGIRELCRDARGPINTAMGGKHL